MTVSLWHIWPIFNLDKHIQEMYLQFEIGDRASKLQKVILSKPKELLHASGNSDAYMYVLLR